MAQIIWKFRKISLNFKNTPPLPRDLEHNKFQIVHIKTFNEDVLSKINKSMPSPMGDTGGKHLQTLTINLQLTFNKFSKFAENWRNYEKIANFQIIWATRRIRFILIGMSFIVLSSIKAYFKTFLVKIKAVCPSWVRPSLQPVFKLGGGLIRLCFGKTYTLGWTEYWQNPPIFSSRWHFNP